VKAVTNAMISGAAREGRLASVAPMITIDSPSAMRIKPWHLSARWLPAIVQSAVVERPSHGV